MQLQESIGNILGRPFHSLGTALLAARQIQIASNSAKHVWTPITAQDPSFSASPRSEDDPACVAQNVPETLETVEMVRFASHQQVQQHTVEHVPQIIKETAETMRLASHEQVQQQTVEHVLQNFKPVAVNTYVAPSVAPSLPDFSAFVNPQYSTTSVEDSTQRIQEQIVSKRIEEQIGDILVLNTVDQEQIIAGRTAQNIVGFLAVLRQMKIHEFPEVQVTERIQEQIVFQGTVETTCVVPQDHCQGDEFNATGTIAFTDP